MDGSSSWIKSRRLFTGPRRWMISQSLKGNFLLYIWKNHLVVKFLILDLIRVDDDENEICEKERKYSSMFHFEIGKYRCDKRAYLSSPFRPTIESVEPMLCIQIVTNHHSKEMFQIFKRACRVSGHFEDPFNVVDQAKVGLLGLHHLQFFFNACYLLRV